ncbi:hypothetical protein EIP86_009466 [Pleurotus ostreatoroseus]|nr:hypothetical protein EIP86_009466 [Pleurotus ostreatoroseus]
MSSIVSYLSPAIQLHELRQRSLGRLTDSFVTVSVDGEQQFQTTLIRASLNPSWSFSNPHKLSVYPSSSITFTVYRDRKTTIIGEKYLGAYEAPLLTYLNDKLDNVPHELDIKHCITTEKGAISVDLEVDASGVGTAYDGYLHAAAHKLRNASPRAKRNCSPRPSAGTGAILEQALDFLDHIVHAVDGLVEIHPWCKTAWTLLSSVYKAIRKQRERNEQVSELIAALRDALARATQCRDLKAISGKFVRAATGLSKTLDKRIDQCKARLRELYMELILDLAINTWSENQKGTTKTTVNPLRDATKPSPPPSIYGGEPIPITQSSTQAPNPASWIVTEAQQLESRSSSLRGPPETPLHFAAFPSPVLYPDVAALCHSPDSMRRAIELPEPEHYCLPTPPPSTDKTSRRTSASSAPSSGAPHRTPPRRRWHSDYEVSLLKDMFTSYDDEMIEEILLSKGSQEAAIEALLRMTNEASLPAEDTVLGLGLTASPLPAQLPNLSRSNSSNSTTNSVIATPASETRPDLSTEPSIGLCDGYVGGFAMPDTQSLARSKRRENVSLG